MLFRFWVFPDCTFLDISTLAGEIMLRFACKKGIVVDGCLRDLDGKNVAFLGSYSELYH